MFPRALCIIRLVRIEKQCRTVFSIEGILKQAHQCSEVSSICTHTKTNRNRNTHTHNMYWDVYIYPIYVDRSRGYGPWFKEYMQQYTINH